MNLSTELVLIGILGMVVGAALTYMWRFSERRMRPTEIKVPASAVPAGAGEVLAVLSSSAILVDADDAVQRASAPAVALGLVNDHEVTSPRILDLVHQVRRTGEVIESDFAISRRHQPDLHVHARVAPLGRNVLVLVEDRTREHQVETIRRDFVANVSHELKTPIGALNLLAEAVGEAKDDPEAVVRFSQRMTVESERLTRLVQQIIDLSRLQNDTRSASVAVHKVGDLVAEAAEHSHTDAEGKSIEIAVSSEPDLFVHGDRAQLHSAISNLVENAVTYSPENSKIQVSAAPGDDETVRITVSDSGIGLEDAEINRIFERFYRVDPARARATGGTGLGLSIVKHVVASHGGTVEVWSKPGLGSSFTLVLPAHDFEEENS